MAHWNLAGNRPVVPNILALGPLAAAAVLMAAAAIPVLVLASLVPPSLVLPVLSIVSIGYAGLVGLLAWSFGARRGGDGITAWDVSGICALIGIAAGTFSKPEHVMQLFGLATTAQ